MGPVEKMLFDFCNNNWTVEDEAIRIWCIRRVNNPMVVTPVVWKCFYRRHPDLMRNAAKWSRTVARLVARFDADSALNSIEEMLNGL